MFVKCKTLLTPKSIEGLGEKVQEIFQDLRMENREDREALTCRVQHPTHTHSRQKDRKGRNHPTNYTTLHQS